MIMKVWIFKDYYASGLADQINDFIATHKVLNIQYQLSISDHKDIYSAMVTYEDLI